MTNKRHTYSEETLQEAVRKNGGKEGEGETAKVKKKDEKRKEAIEKRIQRRRDLKNKKG